jgi:hypothetical protein
MFEKDTCGACIAFLTAHSVEAEETLGTCRLRPEMGRIPQALPRCSKYVEKGTGKTYKTKRPAHGRAPGWYDDTEVEIVSGRGATKGQTHSSDKGPSSKSKPSPIRIARKRSYGASIDLGGDDVDTQALKELIRDVLNDEGLVGDIPMGEKWHGGTLVLKPADDSLKPKEIPIEIFFRKVVTVRERLRVLEQKVNTNKKMSDQDKADIQTYITRIYGSLTTFNVLFSEKRDHFVGEKSS